MHSRLERSSFLSLFLPHVCWISATTQHVRKVQTAALAQIGLSVPKPFSSRVLRQSPFAIELAFLLLNHACQHNEEIYNSVWQVHLCRPPQKSTANYASQRRFTHCHSSPLLTAAVNNGWCATAETWDVPRSAKLSGLRQWLQQGILCLYALFLLIIHHTAESLE